MIFDILVIAALLVSCVIAFLRGFIREVLTIVGVLGGGAAALYAGPLLAPVVKGWLGADNEGEQKKLFDIIPYTLLGDILAYGTTFIVVVIVLSVVSHFLSKGARAVGLGALDRAFGVLFGMVRGVLFLALFYLPVYMLVDKETRDGWFEGSRTRFYVEGSAAWIAGMLPESAKVDAQKKAESTAGSVSKITREKLQELDLLHSDTPDEPAHPAADGAGQENENSGGESKSNGGGAGYDDNSRQEMQNMIGNKVND